MAEIFTESDDQNRPINLQKFKELLKNEHSEDKIVQSCLYDVSSPYCFKQEPEAYYALRSEVCKQFEIHEQNFTIVGSAKLGFSLSPEKFGRSFDESSDIDVVLVSEKLFQKLWDALLEYKNKPVYRLDPEVQKKFKDMQEFMFYGWIRFDKIPRDFLYARVWWNFFSKLSSDKRFGPRKIRAAIFKSWFHASYCYVDTIRKLRSIISEEQQ